MSNSLWITLCLETNQLPKCIECGGDFWTDGKICMFCRVKSRNGEVVDANKPASAYDADEFSRPVAESQYKGRRMNGAIILFLGLFMFFIFYSAIDKAGTDPSAGLIALISVPLMVFGAVAVLAGIVMLLSSSGTDDSASIEQRIETRDSNNESSNEGREPESKSVDYSASDFIKETASRVVGRVVLLAIFVPLLLLLTVVVLGPSLIDYFFR